MNSYRRWWQAFLSALLLVLVAAIWMLFAPVQLGGQASYVIVNGSSMEPSYHLGDLVILHQAVDYQLGDAVAYYDGLIGKYIFHRVIGAHLDRYILKGDNNSWTDSYQPVRQELAGKLWIYIPGAGGAVKWLRTPIYMAIATGLAGVLVMAMIFQSKNGKKKNMKKKTAIDLMGRLKKWIYTALISRPAQSALVSTSKARKSGAVLPKAGLSEGTAVPNAEGHYRTRVQVIEIIFFVFGFIALASLVLGIFAFTRPLLQKVPYDASYRQTGTFSYTASAPSGVYDTQTVDSGQPVFPKLTCLVNLRFTYTLQSGQALGLTGTHQLIATISETRSSWTRTLPLENLTTFSGDTFTASALVDMCQIISIVETMEQKTEIQPTFYSLTINPHVNISGNIAGLAFTDAFQPDLVMQFDKTQVYVYRTDPEVNPLNPVQDGLLRGYQMEANSLPLFGLQLPVGQMRTVSEIGLGASLLVLIVLVVVVSVMSHRSRNAYVQMKYGSMLVDVQNPALDPGASTVEVISLDDLAKIAERQNTYIFHEVNGLRHSYFVQGDRITYRHTFATGSEATASGKKNRIKK